MAPIRSDVFGHFLICRRYSFTAKYSSIFLNDPAFAPIASAPITPFRVLDVWRWLREHPRGFVDKYPGRCRHRCHSVSFLPGLGVVAKITREPQLDRVRAPLPFLEQRVGRVSISVGMYLCCRIWSRARTVRSSTPGACSVV